MTRRVSREFIIVLVLSLLTYLGHRATIVWDMTWYISHGFNLLHGLGYTGPAQVIQADDLMRGPLFPLMIGAAMSVNPTPEAAFWVVRLFALLTPLMLYALGRELTEGGTGRWLGLGAATGYLASWAVNNASMRHIDAVGPFFVLLSIYGSSRKSVGKNRHENA